MRAALAISVLVLAAYACDAAAPAAAPNTPLASIAGALTRLAATGRFSGAVLVARNGRPVLTRAYGLADRATHQPNRGDTRFNLASLGKTFTAVTVARLVEEGKLRFDDTIGRYLPELPPALGDRITVAELLDHTSGLGDFFASPDYRAPPPHADLARPLPAADRPRAARSPTGIRVQLQQLGLHPARADRRARQRPRLLRRAAA
jgi:CubicO group peptidase (beta-lactamase class C family)